MSGWLVHWLVRLIGCTLRWRVEGPPGFTSASVPQPMLVTFWHNRIFLLPYLYRRDWPRTQASVLVSASNDGAKLVSVLKHFNLGCVRGSSSRRGREALRELVRLVRQGESIGITPDGPRGPKYVVQPGIISLAQLTGVPIVPVSYVLSHKITFNSWDNFMVPLPFSRCTVRWGSPLTVPRDADEALREHKRLELRTVLLTLSGEPLTEEKPQ